MSAGVGTATLGPVSRPAEGTQPSALAASRVSRPRRNPRTRAAHWRGQWSSGRSNAAVPSQSRSASSWLSRTPSLRCLGTVDEDSQAAERPGTPARRCRGRSPGRRRRRDRRAVQFQASPATSPGTSPGFLTTMTSASAMAAHNVAPRAGQAAIGQGGIWPPLVDRAGACTDMHQRQGRDGVGVHGLARPGVCAGCRAVPPATRIDALPGERCAPADSTSAAPPTARTGNPRRYRAPAPAPLVLRTRSLDSAQVRPGA